MLSVQGVGKEYGNQVIFRDVAFHINPGERIGLIGRNGHGKTTLFNLLTGKEEPDEGAIAISRDYRIGFLQQHLGFTQATVLAEACLGLPDDRKDEVWKVKKHLSGLGFTENDFDRPPDEFSGGYQVRLSLAKVLATEPNLLLLDEPTNYLDIISIRWLVRFLKSWRNELLVISHDRGFIDSISTHIIGIHRLRARKVAGSTAHYYTQINQEEEVHERQRVNQEKKKKQLEAFVTKFRAKARQANLAQSRMKTLAKMDQTDKLSQVQDLSFSFNAAPFQAKYALEARDVTFSYGANTPELLKDFTLTVGGEDRICIIGKNGKGKTTLLKLLAGRLQPGKGETWQHARSQCAYYEQSDTAGLSPERSVEDEILAGSVVGERQVARSIAGAMMFSGDLALKQIKVLSGGEKCRVLMGKLLVTPATCLLLDEPTHHLDMPSTDALINAVAGFPGASVIVTHDEHFLRGVATRLVVFRSTGVTVFNGTYNEFLDQIGWEDEDDLRARAGKGSGGRQKVNRKEQRKARAVKNAKQNKLLGPLQKKVDGLESLIMEKEEQLGLDNAALLEASQNHNMDEITRLSKIVPLSQTEIDKLYEDLAYVSEEYYSVKNKLSEESD